MELELYGTNAHLGSQVVELSDKRRALVTDDEHDPFPLGTGGLIPVACTRKDGGERTIWVFACGEEAGDTPGVEAPACLLDAVRLVNRILDQACELSGYSFGCVEGISVGVPATGWGFTRVEMVPLDAHGKPNPAPLRLVVNTAEAGEGVPWSLKAVVDYAPDGSPAHMALTEYGGHGESCKVTVSINDKTGKLSVQKVEEAAYPDEKPRLLYKRGWEKSHPRPFGRR